jgi:IQ motif/SEC7 domain-containing protein
MHNGWGQQMASINMNGISSSTGMAGMTTTIISNSASRMSNYEISDEVNRLHLQHLERKYGGRIRAHMAATKIQRAFRRFRLEQQWQRLRVSGPTGSARRQGHSPRVTAETEQRQMRMRQLALSQPSLKYHPATSLRAQLRAERCGGDGGTELQPLRSAQTQASNSVLSPRRMIVEPPTSPQPRPYLELMSPRLSQRRVISVSSSQMQVLPVPSGFDRRSSTHSSFNSAECNSSSSTAKYYQLLPTESVPSDCTAAVAAAVASGTSPSIWVPRVHTPHTQQHHPSSFNTQQTRDSPQYSSQGGARNGSPSAVFANGDGANSPQQLSFVHANPSSRRHEMVVAYHTNSLPRMGRRHESLYQVTAAASQQENTRSTSMVQHPIRDWPDQQRRRLYRIALNFFNKKPDRGVQLLIHWGFVDDNPQSIAKLFLGRRGLSKQMIGEFLGTLQSPFHEAVLERFVNEIPMYEMDIDVALRQLLTHFRLPGEAQKIDHIMEVRVIK